MYPRWKWLVLGIDDVLALLLALSSRSEEIEVKLISLTFGNIDVRSCLRNLVSMFHTIERELSWRRENGKPEGFEALRACKPVVAVGANRPLQDEMMMADYFRETLPPAFHPHLTPEQTWESLFFPSTQSGAAPASDTAKAALAHSQHSLFIGSKTPAHQEMLRILKENDPETVTIVAVGPLTNLALAAAEDPETFLRAKEVVVMGGAIDVPGNVTPTAEFNMYADPTAAARVFALTSPRPASTMPPTNPSLTTHQLPAYPTSLSKQLTLTLLPLDLTDQHRLTRGQFRSRTTAAPQTATTNATAVVATPSPLAAWLTIILEHSFATLDALYPGHAGDQAALSLHDPLCIWYVLTSAPPLPLPSPSPPSSGGGVGWQPSTGSPEDIRVETTGQWTRGMCVVDRRGRRRRDSDDDGASFSDNGHWLSDSSGNRVVRMASSPGPEGFGGHMLERIFG
ncbi:inosine-uridine preferring nucleoside hydrolase [Histoplasma capsulatum var. duboisii H88]|uniref:Inosine-uridine preferring nucleoside hydrolase n=2 Tax=Ajellomyces capsulatus (strain H88) TaxID=544711 RepID=F0UCZ5_AJEC8|nr:inosine-uridine preferring nucleoside hydrolase [Histoplasma capsulatum var. duboisii H88]